MKKNAKDQIIYKKLLFEYFVCQLLRWKRSLDPSAACEFTKLQLHKLLFLSAAIIATENEKGLFEIFSNFYALKYGPVELDIYHAMVENKFSTLTFGDRKCTITTRNTNYNLREDDIALVDRSIQSLRSKSEEYIFYDSFKLVSITHEWTVWKTSYGFAEIVGKKMEKMSVDEIIHSKVKAY